jgi:hypothetical protein
MGSVFNVACSCGYQGSTTVGAGRSDFKTNSTFPFYCDKCGMVSANITVSKPVCSDCNSADIKQYGKPPISPDGGDSYFMQWGKYRAGKEGHLCPMCKGNTMVFERYMMFD